MIRPLFIVSALALAAVLAGCAAQGSGPSTTGAASPSGNPGATATATASAAPSSTPTPTPAPAPSVSAPAEPTADPSEPLAVDAAAYLLEGTPGVPDADGFWKGHYGFFTDASKAVRCDIRIYSGDPTGVTCAISTGNEPKVTYALPPVDCEAADGNPVDGYSVGINVNVFPDANAGFTGCGAGFSDFFAVTRVLPDRRVIQVDTITCANTEGEVVCIEATTGALIRFGLTVAEFSG